MSKLYYVVSPDGYETHDCAEDAIEYIQHLINHDNYDEDDIQVYNNQVDFECMNKVVFNE